HGSQQAISRRISVPSIGCADHRFNLAVRKCLEPQVYLIKKVSALMKKLKTVKRVAKLKLHGCYYKPIPLHELRWSGCYRVLKRFEDLQPRIHLFMDDCTVEDDESDGDDSTTNPNAENLRRILLVDLIPSPSEQRKSSRYSTK
ncbi:hypothetical protein L916_05380, partial [Phytophthora nicotianae]